MTPAATALHLPSSGMLTLSGQKPVCNYTTSSSSSHRYTLSSGYRFRITALPDRACVVFKESLSGFHLAWLARISSTSSDHKGFLISAKKSTEGHGGCDADTWLSALEVKPTGLDNSPAPVLTGDPDLLKIPGVGPKNLTKLVENDITSVTDLKKLYKDKFFGKSDQKMIEFLQSSVGIKYRNHAKSIASFIRKSVSKEMKDGGAKSEIAISVSKETKDGGANSEIAIPIPDAAPKKKVKEARRK
ncbi:unnamed protein product [Lactuca virosa]|uniref:Uncharacterized protein n=1 Tax=Lactuca virosa TaxID=75947 RepID=A0AAU9NZ99_9ASTR|nr:unnamed protein product [Lactuca virosa]